MESVFWGSVAFIAYVYVGYPLMLAAYTRLVRRQPRLPQVVRAQRRDDLPGVSVVIAARNEAHRLPDRIANLLESDYPSDRLQIIVASDGSTDDTVDALASYRDRVELVLLPPLGKANALNAAVLRAIHPVLVFADARQRFAPDAIRRLVTHFRDPQVGAVSGQLILDCEDADQGESDKEDPSSTIAEGVGTYWRYEKWLRRHEAVVGSMVGVTGAIYAMRRYLWQCLPTDTLLDDVLGPMRLVMRGYRVTFEPGAHAFDRTAPDAAHELRRKMRTLAGNFQMLAQEPRVLLPLINPVWLQFVSHKIGRLLVPYALIAIFVSNAVLMLTAASRLYALTFSAQVVFYGLAVYGAALDHRARTAVVSTCEVNREAA
jgi:cellulose synthase/poly-beta-1,6-N-acetylglucosamine synthase-like glycosyltransferase